MHDYDDDDSFEAFSRLPQRASRDDGVITGPTAKEIELQAASIQNEEGQDARTDARTARAGRSKGYSKMADASGGFEPVWVSSAAQVAMPPSRSVSLPPETGCDRPMAAARTPEAALGLIFPAVEHGSGCCSKRWRCLIACGVVALGLGLGGVHALMATGLTGELPPTSLLHAQSHQTQPPSFQAHSRMPPDPPSPSLPTPTPPRLALSPRQPPAAQAWDCHQGKHCDTRGAASVDDNMYRLDTVAACQELCNEHLACGAVVFAPCEERAICCFLRNNVQIELCDDNPHLSTCLKPVLPERLVAALDDYNVQVYGVRGVIDAASKIRLLWAELLSTEVLTQLAIRCKVPSGVGVNSPPSLYIHPPENFHQRSAVWVHRPPDDWPTDYPDHAWVEVTHCGYSGHEGITRNTPMWFFVAAGSGVWLNLGRSHRVDLLQSPSPVRPGLMPNYYSSKVLSFKRCLVSRGRSEECAREYGIDFNGYETVQFPRSGGPLSWGAEYFTEIVALDMFWEGSFLVEHLENPNLRCGPLNDLRACRAAEPAIQQMSRCSMPFGNEHGVVSSPRRTPKLQAEAR